MVGNLGSWAFFLSFLSLEFVLLRLECLEELHGAPLVEEEESTVLPEGPIVEDDMRDRLSDESG